MIAEVIAPKPFTERPGRIVPDTSAFIESVYFDEFSWQSLDGVIPAGLARLIVPILVIEEIDALKRDHNGPVSGRARSVLRRLWELHAADPAQSAALPCSAATVELCLDDPWHVRRPVNNDEIIQRAVTISEIAGRDTLLAAGDHSMPYRAGLAASSRS